MIPRIIIGSMNVRGMLQRPDTSTVTPAGGRPKTWVDVLPVWMNVTAAAGKEQLFGMKITASMTHVIVMRYRSDVTEKMRIVIKGVPHQIKEIDDVEYRGRKLILGVERGVAS